MAQGFAQREGVDYRETYAPVLHYKTLRVILAVVAHQGYVLLQMDVPTAFLNASVKETVLMKPPPGLQELGLDGADGAQPGMICKLVKTLYGIKQAPREWNSHFNESIVALGYQRCSGDTCVYVRTSKTGRPIYIPVFVDDVFPACHPADLVEMKASLAQLMKKYGIESCDEAGAVLGMRITRDVQTGKLKLDQEVYIKKVLTTFGMDDGNSAVTPEEERAAARQSAATVHDDEEAGWREYYGSIVGAVLYIALSTRPDIAHAASMRARVVSSPSYSDWLACKRILRYLKGTSSMGLTFSGGPSGGAAEGVVLDPCFCDADWAGDTEDRRSTTGFIMKVCGSAVSWASKKQTSVALSSAEAEYMAAGTAAQEIIWLRTLLMELGFGQRQATVLLSDNQAAIAIASDDQHHARTKHIDIRHHFIREHVIKETLRMEWIAGSEQQADILTKPLGRLLFVKLRDRVLGAQ